jgi:hypothetical protein
LTQLDGAIKIFWDESQLMAMAIALVNENFNNFDFKIIDSAIIHSWSKLSNAFETIKIFASVGSRVRSPYWRGNYSPAAAT